MFRLRILVTPNDHLFCYPSIFMEYFSLSLSLFHSLSFTLFFLFYFILYLFGLCFNVYLYVRYRMCSSFYIFFSFFFLPISNMWFGHPHISYFILFDRISVNRKDSKVLVSSVDGWKLNAINKKRYAEEDLPWIICNVCVNVCLRFQPFFFFLASSFTLRILLSNLLYFCVFCSAHLQNLGTNALISIVMMCFIVSFHFVSFDSIAKKKKMTKFYSFY